MGGGSAGDFAPSCPARRFLPSVEVSATRRLLFQEFHCPLRPVSVPVPCGWAFYIGSQVCVAPCGTVLFFNLTASPRLVRAAGAPSL